MSRSDTNVAPSNRLARRDLMKLSGVGAAALAASSLFNPSDGKASTMETQTTSGWDKVFPQSDKVDHQKVMFKTATASPWRAISTCRRCARTIPWPRSSSAGRLAR